MLDCAPVEIKKRVEKFSISCGSNMLARKTIIYAAAGTAEVGVVGEEAAAEEESVKAFLRQQLWLLLQEGRQLISVHFCGAALGSDNERASLFRLCLLVIEVFIVIE